MSRRLGSQRGGSLGAMSPFTRASGGLGGGSRMHDAIGSFVVDAAGQRLMHTVAQRDRESDAARRTARWIVQPSEPAYLVWSVVLGVFICFFLVAVPMRLSFSGTTDDPFIQGTGAWLVVDLIADIVFILDLLLSFRTAFHRDGELVVAPRAIAISYLRSWFALDLLASIPTSFISLSEDDSEVQGSAIDFSSFNQLLRGGRIGKLLRLLRLFKLLRVFRLSKSFRHLQAYSIFNPSFMRSVAPRALGRAGHM